MTEDKNIFGEKNEVFNALHSELTFIKEDIENVQKAIKKNEEKLGKLEVRKEKLESAAAIAKKSLKGVSQTKKK